MNLSESKNQNIEWGANLINSTILAFAFTLLWVNIFWYFIVSLDVGIDPLTRHTFQRGDTHPLLYALLIFLAFWGSVYALHFCNQLFNIRPLLKSNLHLNTPLINSTLIGWLLGSAVAFALLCTRFQSMFETSF